MISWRGRQGQRLILMSSERQKNALKMLSSRDYTHAYCREWADSEKTGRRPKDKIFLLFPNLGEGIRGKHILEIGCGQGQHLELLRDAGALVAGIDLFMEPMSPNAAKGDFMTFSFGARYDFIFAFGVFERCATYSPAALKQDEFKREMDARNPPQKMLARLVELMAETGVCLFSTYADPLIFTKEMASALDLRLSHHRRKLDSEKHGNGMGGRMGVGFAPERYYILQR